MLVCKKLQFAKNIFGKFVVCNFQQRITCATKRNLPLLNMIWDSYIFLNDSILIVQET